MKPFILSAVLAASLALPAGAQGETPRPEPSPGGELGRIFGEFLGAVDPWFRDLGSLLGDLSGWHAPEVLENGDVLIRRRRPQDEQAPEAQPAEPSAPPSEPLEL